MSDLEREFLTKLVEAVVTGGYMTAVEMAELIESCAHDDTPPDSWELYADLADRLRGFCGPHRQIVPRDKP